MQVFFEAVMGQILNDQYLAVVKENGRHITFRKRFVFFHARKNMMHKMNRTCRLNHTYKIHVNARRVDFNFSSSSKNRMIIIFFCWSHEPKRIVQPPQRRQDASPGVSSVFKVQGDRKSVILQIPRDTKAAVLWKL